MKARVEAEDSQRMLLGALNGIAALLAADKKVAEAVGAYRQVWPVLRFCFCAQQQSAACPPSQSCAKLVPLQGPASCPLTS